MNDEEKEIIERIQQDSTFRERNLLRIIEQQNKMIDLMAEQLVKAHEWFYSEFDNYTKEDFIEYFENKVKESK